MAVKRAMCACRRTAHERAWQSLSAFLRRGARRAGARCIARVDWRVVVLERHAARARVHALGLLRRLFPHAPDPGDLAARGHRVRAIVGTPGDRHTVRVRWYLAA